MAKKTNTSKKKLTIVFSENQRQRILRAFNKEVDKDQELIDAQTKTKVITSEGETIKEKELGAIKIGSEIYYKKDISSILKLYESLVK